MTSPQELSTWLVSNGAVLHPSLEIRQDPSWGSSTWLAPEPKLQPGPENGPESPDSPSLAWTPISIPFSLAVTPELALRAIKALLPEVGDEALTSLEERECVIVYLVLHWLVQDGSLRDETGVLRHQTYLASLPSEDDCLTPLWWNAEERGLLKGTSVFGAAEEMERSWREGRNKVGSGLGLTEEGGWTWSRYLLASTYLSSRAFPSRLLHLPTPEDPTPSTDSHPILLPGIDLLNHKPNHAVEWISSPGPPTSTTSDSPAAASLPADSLASSSTLRGRISVVLPRPTPAGEQIFNNYGAKPNDELLLAYGFCLPSLAYDTSPLLLAPASLPPGAKDALETDLGLDVGKRFLVGRDGVVEGELRCAVRWLVGDGEERQTMRQWAAEGKTSEGGNWHARPLPGGENEMNVLSLLEDMVRQRLGALQAAPPPIDDGEGAGVRDEVRRLVGVYKEGQIEILQAAERYLGDELERVAAENGFDLGESEEEGESREEEGE